MKESYGVKKVGFTRRFAVLKKCVNNGLLEVLCRIREGPSIDELTLIVEGEGVDTPVGERLAGRFPIEEFVFKGARCMQGYGYDIALCFNLLNGKLGVWNGIEVGNKG